MKKDGCYDPPAKGMIGPRVGHLSKMTKNAFNKALAEQGLFSGQQYILFVVNHHEGISMCELSKELGVAPATVSVSVKRMEKSGFIIRKTDEEDARLTRLYPTEKARQAPENIRKKMTLIDETLKKGMTPEEIELLSDLLDRAAENMKAEDNTYD